MTTAEEARLAAQGAPDSSAAADARADREARLAHDEAQLRLPPAEQPHGRAIQT